MPYENIVEKDFQFTLNKILFFSANDFNSLPNYKILN